METMPTRDDLIAWLVNQTAVPFDVLKANPHGFRPDMGTKILRAAEQDSGARLDLCPPDVFDEIADVAARMDEQSHRTGYLLTSRRILESFNSSFHGNAITKRRHDTNRLYMHPEDLAHIGASDDDALRIRSRHGEVIGYARHDAGMKRGVVSMAHCWGAGSQPDPLFLRGAHTGKLISMQEDIQSINRMPLQSGVAVNVEKLDFTLQQAQEKAASGA